MPLLPDLVIDQRRINQRFGVTAEYTRRLVLASSICAGQTTTRCLTDLVDASVGPTSANADVGDQACDAVEVPAAAEVPVGDPAHGAGGGVELPPLEDPPDAGEWAAQRLRG